MKGRDVLEFIAINGRIILNCILIKYFLICGLHFFDTEWGPVMDSSKDSD